MALNMITKLSDTSSKQELDQIKALMKGKENDIKAKLENTVMEGEKDPKFTAGRDINQLYNSTYGASQIGIFQAWNHGIFYEKTFVQGLKLFFSGVYKPLLVDYMLKNKICDAKIGDYPSIVLFFANIGLSTLTEVSDDYFLSLIHI